MTTNYTLRVKLDDLNTGEVIRCVMVDLVQHSVQDHIVTTLNGLKHFHTLTYSG